MALRDDGDGWWLVDIKGHFGKTLEFAPVSCFEEMENGIRLSIAHHWCVVSFKDFEAMYNLAKAARENDD